MEIWNIIVQSNTFNFLIFVALFALIFKKCKIGEKIASMQSNVIQTIENAKKAKEDSILELKKSNELVKNVKKEVKVILDEALSSTEKISKKIASDADAQVENIHINSEKLVKTEGQKIISDLSRKTALASVEVAKKHIISMLQEKPQYHAGFIVDSIEEFDKGNF